jgi:hypothetical protein
MGDEVKESRRETMLKAWDEVEEKEEKTEVYVKEEKPALEVKAPIEEPTPEVKEDKLEQKPAEDDKKEAAAAAELERKRPDTTTTERAPQSWKPEIREHWAKLPPEVRAEVNRRELQIQRTLSETATVRRFAQDFANVVSPYAHMIKSQNSTPLAAVDNLMRTAAGLMNGSPEQKATIVAEIIGGYGVDIKTLDNLLSSGKHMQAPQAAPAIPQWAQPIFGFMQNLQQSQQQRMEQEQAEAQQAVEAFAEKPFFEDLREEIADIMEMAARRGRKMTLEDGYRKAIELNPEISKIVKQREAAAQQRNPVSEAAATLARARKAASTVNSPPAGTKVGAKSTEKKTRKEQMSEAWDELQS